MWCFRVLFESFERKSVFITYNVCVYKKCMFCVCMYVTIKKSWLVVERVSTQLLFLQKLRAYM